MKLHLYFLSIFTALVFSSVVSAEDTTSVSVKIHEKENVNIYTACIEGYKFAFALRDRKFTTEGQPSLVQIIGEGGEPVKCKMP